MFAFLKNVSFCADFEIVDRMDNFVKQTYIRQHAHLLGSQNGPQNGLEQGPRFTLENSFSNANRADVDPTFALNMAHRGQGRTWDLQHVQKNMELMLAQHSRTLKFYATGSKISPNMDHPGQKIKHMLPPNCLPVMHMSESTKWLF